MQQKYPVFGLVNAKDKTKVVAMYFSKGISFSLKKKGKDLEDHFLLLKGAVGNRMYTFISY